MTIRKVTSDLQGALNNAKPGDTLILPARQTFTAPQDGFVLPAQQDGSEPIIVQSSEIDQIPSDRRVGQQDAQHMAKLVTKDGQPVLSCASEGAQGYKLQGLEKTTLPNPPDDHYVGTLVNLGRYAAKRPRNIELDRCWIHSQEDYTDNAHTTVKILVQVEGSDITLKNSRIASPGAYAGSGYGFDNTAGVMMIDGPGPLTIDNCFLNSWFTPYFMGGGNLSTDNIATILPNPAPSMTGAMFSNVNNLAVDDLVAIADKPALKDGDPKLGGFYFEVAKVTGISGNFVSFKPWAGNIANNPASTVSGDHGIPLTQPPMVPGQARWNGRNPSNVKITRTQFHINPVVGQQIHDDAGIRYGGDPRVPKGYFEIKACDGLNMDGCEFTGWPSTFAMTQHNQTGPNGGPSPWSVIKDVLIRNFYYHPAKAFGSQLIGLLLEDNVGTSVIGGNVQFENGLFTTGGWLGDFFAGKGVRFIRTTCLNDVPWPDGKLMNVNYVPIEGFELMDSIIFNHEYGINLQDEGSLPGKKMSGNVLITGKIDRDRPNCTNGSYPPGNSCPTTLAQVGFVDPANGNYRLASSSPYKGKATDGGDPGCDIDKLMVALSETTPDPVPTNYRLDVVGGSGSGTYPDDSVVPISASVPSGKQFDKWTGTVADPNQASTTVHLKKDETVTAGFKAMAESNTAKNVALSANGGVATASSTYDNVRGPKATINGDRKAKDWATDPVNGSGWHSKDQVPPAQWLQVNFSGPKTINEIDVFTVQDNYTSPVEPTPDLEFKVYGIQDFEVQYWNGTAWLKVGEAKNNKLIWTKFTFPPVTTDKIRVFVTKAADGYARIAEIEAYESASVPVSIVHFPVTMDCEVTSVGGVVTGVSLTQV